MSDPKALAVAKTSLAGGLIATAILDALYKKGVFDIDECRAILNSAMTETGHIIKSGNATEGIEAQKLIASMLQGQFSKRG